MTIYDDNTVELMNNLGSPVVITEEESKAFLSSFIDHMRNRVLKRTV